MDQNAAIDWTDRHTDQTLRRKISDADDARLNTVGTTVDGVIDDHLQTLEDGLFYSTKEAKPLADRRGWNADENYHKTTLMRMPNGRLFSYKRHVDTSQPGDAFVSILVGGPLVGTLFGGALYALSGGLVFLGLISAATAWATLINAAGVGTVIATGLFGAMYLQSFKEPDAATLEPHNELGPGELISSDWDVISDELYEGFFGELTLVYEDERFAIGHDGTDDRDEGRRKYYILAEDDEIIQRCGDRALKKWLVNNDHLNIFRSLFGQLPRSADD